MVRNAHSSRVTATPSGSVPLFQRRMSAGGHQVCDRGARVAASHQRLAYEHDIGAGLGVLEDVVGSSDPGLGDSDDTVRDQRSQVREGATIDLKGLQIACV